MNAMTPDQKLFFDIMCVWVPIAVYVFLNILFFAELFGFCNWPKELKKVNIVTVLSLGPTILACIIIIFWI